LAFLITTFKVTLVYFFIIEAWLVLLIFITHDHLKSSEEAWIVAAVTSD